MNETTFAAEWLGSLLAAIDQNVPSPQKGRIFDCCALAHYQALNMEDIIARYSGDLPAFLNFLTETWHWVITYDAAAGLIIADENKTSCVCPLVQAGLVKNAPGLCACSEQFAERMFTAVLHQPVRASVVTSIQRGDPTCKYAVQVLAHLPE